MKLLLDTHILLWFQAGDPALPKAAEQAIRSEANEGYGHTVGVRGLDGSDQVL